MPPNDRAPARVRAPGAGQIVRLPAKDASNSQRFALVHGDVASHAVFREPAGGTTLRVYVWLSQRALTDRRRVTAERPLGRVVGGEEALSTDLGLTAKTVRHHLRRLQDAGLIILWRRPVRAPVRQEAGRWRGLATEYLVVAHADQPAVADAIARYAGERNALTPAGDHRRAGPKSRIVERGPDGRFRRSGVAPTGNPTPIPDSRSAPPATGDAPPAYETLEYETLKPETFQSEGSSAPRDDGNRRAWQMLRRGEEGGLLRPLNPGARSTIATALSEHLDADEMESAIACLAEGRPRTERELRQLVSEHLGVPPSELWGNLRQPRDLSSERFAEPRKLADLLADLIAENGSNRPKVTAAWVDEVERMIRLDGRTPEEVERCIRWCQQDQFWRATILSARKLRRHFNQMSLQARRHGHAPARRHVPESWDAIQRVLAERQEPANAEGPSWDRGAPERAFTESWAGGR